MKTPKNNFISLESVYFSFDGKDTLNDISFSINRGDKITIVGKNGVGKSTLLQLLIKKIHPDEGKVVHQDDVSIAYLPQTIEFEEGRDQNIAEFITEFMPNLNSIDCSKIGEKKTIAEFNQKGGHKIYKVLAGLGLSRFSLDQSLNSMSGGERARVSLAKILMQEPDLFILDEPTNHLDFSGLNWLERYLNRKQISFVLVTHDRMLLNNITNQIFEIDEYSKKLEAFGGTYEDLLERKRQKQELDLQRYSSLKKEEKTLKIKNLIEKNASHFKVSRKDNNKLAFNARGARKQNHIGVKINKQQKRLDEIKKETAIMPADPSNFSWGLAESCEQISTSNTVLDFYGVSKKLNDSSVLSGCSGIIYKGERVILQGRNGVGKTTLLRVLRGEIEKDEGVITWTAGLKIGYLPQLQTMFDPNVSVIEGVQSIYPCSEEFFHDLLRKYCLFDLEFRNKTISDLSIGQQRRLQLAIVLAQNPNVLILDEPTNHLDYLSCEYLELQLSQYNGTLLAISHDRRFIQKLGTSMWILSKGEIKKEELPLSNLAKPMLTA